MIEFQFKYSMYYRHRDYLVHTFSDKIKGRLYVYMPFRRRNREYWVYGLKKKHLLLVQKFNDDIR